MGTYVELSQVKTWYDERGEGEPLVLLHGGVVDARFFDRTSNRLRPGFVPLQLDRGRLPRYRPVGHDRADAPRSPRTLSAATAAIAYRRRGSLDSSHHRS